MKALITGGTGFAGRHLCELLDDAGRRRRPRVARRRRPARRGGDRAAVAEAGARRRLPPRRAGARRPLLGGPRRNAAGNLASAVNLLEAVRAARAGGDRRRRQSGEVYGPPDYAARPTSAPLRPQNPYAVSKAATDLLARFYADAHGLSGDRPRLQPRRPRQDPIYAIASFARQLAAGLVAGDDPIRIVHRQPRHAPRLHRRARRRARLPAAGRAGRPGEAYNVCSGETASAAELVAALGAGARVEVEHAVDPALVRAHEVMEVRGSFDKLRSATGWEPSIALETTLSDTVQWWREQLS